MTRLDVARLCLMAALLTTAPPAEASKPVLVGWVEKARLLTADVEVRAKVDTGARTSSLDARNIRRFRRGRAWWVRFTVGIDRGKTVTLERPVHRVARIKRHGARHQRRFTVLLPIRLGPVVRTTEVTLTDRSRFHYPLLLGRRFLKGGFIVDPSRVFLHSKKKVSAKPGNDSIMGKSRQ